MALNKQINIYSVDTSAFYTRKEMAIHRKISQITQEKKVIKDKLKELLQSPDKTDEEKEYIKRLEKYKSMKNRRLKSLKEKLYDLLKSNHIVRVLNPRATNEHNIVSIFDSSLTRIMGCEQNKLYDDLIIVQTYFFDVLKDLITRGFYYTNPNSSEPIKEKYVCFMASAGQIRTKKTVFIKERILRQYENTITCGLPLSKINAKGGINVNKYLAYLALCNSATDVWEQFDIDRSIVVEDFETCVHGLVDYIDDKTYKIERIEMDVPITHTDGCGMMLPKVNRRNMMVRLPWIKGLLAVFDFRKFITEHIEQYPNCAIVKDIYGYEHNILEEDIEVIFTKSQLKMWKYYENWEEYKNNYKKYNCTAGKCNEEEEFTNAKLNYQMLQTLTDLTDDELIKIASESECNIQNLASDRKTMLKAFGATKYNTHKNAFQKCLLAYPELLSDVYTKTTLKEIKKSLEKDLWSAKLNINGIYTFLIPDLYAFCEFMFLHISEPNGLLDESEVFCKLFKDSPKLDCLRSPHLYKEHAVRNNIIDEEKSKWFTTKAIYTSSHDLISKILQFDNDGDKSLVIADKTIIEAAERNTKDIVPLYYNMAKAGARVIDKNEIYNGMIAAYTGGNIGEISNNITKIWNSGEITEEKLNAVKWLCMENNFVIDYAKTLYKPTRPKEVDVIIKKYTNYKTPQFFQYAKDKKPYQVEEINGSCVNRLRSLHKKTRLKFNSRNNGKFNYKVLIHDPECINEDFATAVMDKYNDIYKNIHIRLFATENKCNNYNYIYNSILQEFTDEFGNIDAVADNLVYGLFKKSHSSRKQVFWEVFGEIIYQHITENLSDKYIQCDRCGTRFFPTNPHQRLCKDCATKRKYVPIGIKKVTCCDCGTKFEVDARNMKKVRCDACQKEYRKVWDRDRKRRQRERTISIQT